MISASKRCCGSKSQALALSDNDFNSSNFDSIGLMGVFLDAGMVTTGSRMMIVDVLGDKDCVVGMGAICGSDLNFELVWW